MRGDLSKQSIIFLEIFVTVLMLLFLVFGIFNSENYESDLAPQNKLIMDSGELTINKDKNVKLKDPLSESNSKAVIADHYGFNANDVNIDLDSYAEKMINDKKSITTKMTQKTQSGIPLREKVISKFIDDSLIMTRGKVHDLDSIDFNKNLLITFDDALDIVRNRIDYYHIVPLYSEDGLYIEFENEVYFPLYAFAASSDDEIIEIFIDAKTGEIIQEFDSRASEPIEGTFESFHYFPDEQFFMRDQIVELKDLSDNVIETTYTDENGYYQFDVPPGDYVVEGRFESEYMSITKSYDPDEDDSVYSEQFNLPLGGVITNNVDWADHEITGTYVDSFGRDRGESNNYFHMADTHNRLLDLGFTSLNDLAFTVTLLNDLSYCTSSAGPASIQMRCTQIYKTTVPRHEYMHVAIFGVGLNYREGGNIDWFSGYPFSSWDYMMTGKSLHEGAAQYFAVSTRDPQYSYGPTVIDFLDAYDYTVYDPHWFGELIHDSFYNLEDELDLLGEDGSTIIQTLHFSTLEMAPKNMHEFFRILIELDIALYGGSHVNLFCETFGEANMVPDNCFGLSESPVLYETINHVDHTMPDSININLQIADSVFYEVSYAPITSLSYTVISSGALNTDTEYDLDVVFDTSSLQPDAYKIKFFVGDGANVYSFTRLVTLSEESPGWPYKTNERFLNPRLYSSDVNLDGVTEIYAGSSAFYAGENDALNVRGVVYNLRSDGSIQGSQFPYTLTNAGTGSPLFTHVDDLNSDGTFEILSAYETHLTVLEENGAVSSMSIPGSIAGPPLDIAGLTVADLNLDGYDEFIMPLYDFPIGSSQGYFAVRSLEDTLSSNYMQWANLPYGSSRGVAVADLSGGPELEVVVSDEYGSVHVMGYSGVALNTYNIGSVSHSRPAIGNLDNQGTQEIVLATDNGVLILDNLGNFVNSFGSVSSRSSPALADIDNDGDLEIFLGSATGLKGYHHDGVEIMFDTLPSVYFDTQHSSVEPNPLETPCTMNLQSPIIGNIDSGPEEEIIIRTDDHCPYVYAYNLNGDVVPGWPKIITHNIMVKSTHNPQPFYRQPDFESYNTPTLVNMDSDSNVEMILAKDDLVHVWELGGDYDLNPPSWPMYGRDSFGSGNYDAPIPQVCEVEMCSDGIDNDCDGRADIDDYECFTCGNGVFETGEECDDGDLESGDGCDSMCFAEDGWICLTGIGSISVCSLGECVTPFDCQGNPLGPLCIDNYCGCTIDAHCASEPCIGGVCGGGVEIMFSSPSNTDVSAGDSVLFSAEVTCTSADCGDVVLTLDPVVKDSLLQKRFNTQELILKLRRFFN